MPGSALEVQALDAKQEHRAAEPTLLLLLEGRLIVDLPLGEFRVLERGDAVTLPAGTALNLQPVASQAIVAWTTAR